MHLVLSAFELVKNKTVAIYSLEFANILSGRGADPNGRGIYPVRRDIQPDKNRKFDYVDP